MGTDLAKENGKDEKRRASCEEDAKLQELGAGKHDQLQSQTLMLVFKLLKGFFLMFLFRYIIRVFLIVMTKLLIYVFIFTLSYDIMRLRECDAKRIPENIPPKLEEDHEKEKADHDPHKEEVVVGHNPAQHNRPPVPENITIELQPEQIRKSADRRCSGSNSLDQEKNNKHGKQLTHEIEDDHPFQAGNHSDQHYPIGTDPTSTSKSKRNYKLHKNNINKKIKLIAIAEGGLEGVRGVTTTAVDFATGGLLSGFFYIFGL